MTIKHLIISATLLMASSTSCSEKHEKCVLTKESLFCADYTWDDLLLTDKVDVNCTRLELIDEPCFTESYLNNFSMAMRLVAVSYRDYARVYRLVELNGCAVFTCKVIPPPYFNVFEFYQTENSQVIKYESLTKRISAEEQQIVLRAVSNLTINTQPGEEEGTEGGYIQIEYYKDGHITKGILTDSLMNASIEEIMSNLCKI